MSAIEEVLTRAGLDPTPAAYPRIVHEGDQIWLKVHAEGRDFVAEIGVRRGFVLLIELALALARIVPR